MSDLLLAVDGGNSKTDLALLRADGTLVAACRAPTVSHQQIGLEGAARRLHALVAEAAGVDGVAGVAPGASEPIAALAVLCLAGVDLPSDERALAAAHGASGIAATVVLENDTLAGLRAGSPAGWGVGVVLGAGLNATGRSPTGRRARFAALGEISGEHGGGGALGLDALGAAVRAQERRGPRTVLETTVPARFGLRRPLDVTTALYRGRLPQRAADELAPVAIEAARAGDPVALELVDRLADEVASFAVAAIRRLSMQRMAVPVVLSGGLARGAGALLADRVSERVRLVAPRATVGILDDPPVVGAALLALDRVAPGDAEAGRRLRASLAHERLEARRVPEPALDNPTGGDR